MLARIRNQKTTRVIRIHSITYQFGPGPFVTAFLGLVASVLTASRAYALLHAPDMSDNKHWTSRAVQNAFTQAEIHTYQLLDHIFRGLGR